MITFLAMLIAWPIAQAAEVSATRTVVLNQGVCVVENGETDCYGADLSRYGKIVDISSSLYSEADYCLIFQGEGGARKMECPKGKNSSSFRVLWPEGVTLPARIFAANAGFDRDRWLVAVCVVDERAGLVCGSAKKGAKHELWARELGAVGPDDQVAMGDDYLCVLRSIGEVNCRGGDYVNDQVVGRPIFASWNRVPALAAPTQLVGGTNHVCVLGANGVQCWGDYRNWQRAIPAMKNPTRLMARGYTTCAETDGQFQCWGGDAYKDGSENFTRTSIPYPYLSAGLGSDICTTSVEGVLCKGFWISEASRFIQGYFGTEPKNESRWARPFFAKNAPYYLARLSIYLRTLAKRTTSARSQYFSALAAQGEGTQELTAVRYLALGLANTAVESMPSEKFVKEEIPFFRQFVGIANRYFKASDLASGARAIPLTEASAMLCLASLQSSLQISLDFLPANEKGAVENALRIVGQVKADPMNREKIHAALVAIDGLIAAKENLSRSSKSAFVGQTIEAAAGWLKGASE